MRPTLILLTALLSLSATSATRASAAPIEEMEARCQTRIYQEPNQQQGGSGTRSPGGWQEVTLSRFVAVVLKKDQWCVDEGDFEFRHGFPQYFETSTEMKQTVDGYWEACDRLNAALNPTQCQPGHQCQQQQCQQRQQWFSAVRERAYGTIACGADFPSLVKAVFPFEKCTVFTVGPKNAYKDL